MKLRCLLPLIGLALLARLHAAPEFPINTPTGPANWSGPVHTNGALIADTESAAAVEPEPVFGLLGTPAGAESFAPDFNTYPQDIQNIVRACNGDVRKIFDLIQQNVAFQPYFGFRKSPELTWQSRRGNDADQAYLLVECLRAAGFDANFRFGMLVMPEADAFAWFGVDNVTGMNQTTGSAGYFGGPSGGFYLMEQIWCTVVIDGTPEWLAPAYKTYDDVAGIDLDTAMNYSQAGLLSAAGGTETATYVQGVSESGLNTYLQGCATDLVSELQSTHPTAAVDEIISGRRIAEQALASDYSNGFYSAGSFVTGSFDTFVFSNPYGDYNFNGTDYSFYVLMSLAVGEVNTAGDTFVASPFITYGGPTGLFFAGKKIALTFDTAGQSAAQLVIDGVVVASESAPPTSNSIGIGYLIEYPYDRSAGTLFDDLLIRPVERTGMYVYAYDSGGAGEPTITTRRRQILENYRRDGLTVSSEEVLTETLYLLGLDWARQFERATHLLAEHREFTPVLHHVMALVKQETGFSVDIPLKLTAVPLDGNTTDPGRNLAALVMMGSSMEHAIIEQNYPDYSAVSTVRYVRENNLAGGKTFLATSGNYSTIQSDADFIAGWNSSFRNSLFPSKLSSGLELVIPEDGAITLDSLTGNGYFSFDSASAGAIINPGSLKGGFATTPGVIDFAENPKPVDPTPGPDNLRNPESYEPIDMLTGAYVYDGTDLSLSGEGVRGLAFTRHYSSRANGQDVGMGPGWSHGYQSSIIEHSDADAALGESTPVHAASLIAATRAVADMVDLPNSPQAWVVGSLAAYWGMEEIQANTATVKFGRRTLPFIKIADGTFIPSAGLTSTLTKDGGTGLYTLEERYDVALAFNADKRISTITDADGKQMSFAYVGSGNGLGKLQTVTDAYGRTLTFNYNGSDLLEQVQDSTGRDVNLAYTGGLLTGVTDPESHTTTYAYDADHRIERIFNEKSEEIAENTYDAFGQISFQVAEDDAAQEWEYAFTGVLNVEINPDIEFMSYVFDDKGRTIETINGEGDTAQMDYDGQNQLVRLTDPRGNITRFEYDGRNNLRFTYDARNGASGTTYKVERQYDSEDRLQKLINEEGNETVFDYDAEHHLTKVTGPLLREVSYGYFTSGDHDGLLETITTPGATAGQTHVTTYAYDSNGYPNSITRPDTSVITQTFNARGDRTFAEITTSGETNTYPVTSTFDLNRRPKTTADALSFGAGLTYDPVGNVTLILDRFSNASSATYSPLGRVESATGSDNETTVFAYDDSGRRSSVTNPLSQTSLFTFDNAGRLETTSNALSETVTLAYDAAGNRSGLTNARSKAYGFTFTANNLPETLTTPLSRTVSYTYDDRLLPKTVEEPSAQTTTFHYYNDGLLEQTVDPVGTIDFTYDAKGRLQTVTEGADTLTRVYDSLDRVTSFTDEAGNVIGYDYDGGDHLTTLTYPASKGDVDYVYDDAGRLQTVTDWAARVTQFYYDANSRLSEIHWPNGTKRVFAYDFAGRVERITDRLISDDSILLDQQFSFDALGRVTSEIVTPEPAAFTITATTMTYDDDDRIANWQSGAANINPVFDVDGNLTSGPLGGTAETFVYDARNRLTQAGTATYAYDAEDRRISKTEGGVATTCVHDPHAPLSRLLQKTTGGVTTYYVYAGAQLLYEETAGQITVYHADRRGSTLALTDSTGTITNRITYGTYGEIVATSTTPTTPFLYNGTHGVQTDDNGLLLMRARYYSPELRRFINADPIGFAGGMNWFAYAGGNPIDFSDPNGRQIVSGSYGDPMLNRAFHSSSLLPANVADNYQKQTASETVPQFSAFEMAVHFPEKAGVSGFTYGVVESPVGTVVEGMGHGFTNMVDETADLLTPVVKTRPFEYASDATDLGAWGWENLDQRSQAFIAGDAHFVKGATMALFAIRSGPNGMLARISPEFALINTGMNVVESGQGISMMINSLNTNDPTRLQRIEDSHTGWNSFTKGLMRYLK